MTFAFIDVQGDVIVGWVNSRTGKGGVDDYFLAGSKIKCDDGAESCPDKNKPVSIKKKSCNNELLIIQFGFREEARMWIY